MSEAKYYLIRRESETTIGEPMTREEVDAVILAEGIAPSEYALFYGGPVTYELPEPRVTFGELPSFGEVPALPKVRKARAVKAVPEAPKVRARSEQDEKDGRWVRDINACGSAQWVADKLSEAIDNGATEGVMRATAAARIEQLGKGAV